MQACFQLVSNIFLLKDYILCPLNSFRNTVPNKEIASNHMPHHKDLPSQTSKVFYLKFCTRYHKLCCSLTNFPGLIHNGTGSNLHCHRTSFVGQRSKLAKTDTLVANIALQHMKTVEAADTPQPKSHHL